MADNKTRVRVDIYGTEYTMRGNESQEHLLTVANRVDSLMRQIAQAMPTLDQRRIAVLAALNMADELVKLQEVHEEALLQLDELTLAMSQERRVLQR